MTVYMKQTARAATALPMSEAERKARVELAAAYRIFDMLGWSLLIFNHITLRVEGPEPRFLINPFGLHYSEITASSLLLVDLEGNVLRESRWPMNRAGFVIHSALHESQPQAHCIMHTHTTTGMAVACLKDGLSPHNFYGAMLQGQVAYHDFEGITVEPGEKERLVRDIGDKRAVILRNHGLLAWGPSVSQAFLTLWTLQQACDVQIAAASAGAIYPVTPQAIAQSVRESGQGEKRTCEDVFAALRRKLDSIDPSYKE